MLLFHIFENSNRNEFLIKQYGEQLIARANQDHSYKGEKTPEAIIDQLLTGDPQNGKNYPVQIDAQEQAYVSVPWTDNNTTYTAATASVLGLVKKGAAVAPVVTGADTAALVTKINELLTSLKNAGIIA